MPRCKRARGDRMKFQFIISNTFPRTRPGKRRIAALSPAPCERSWFKKSFSIPVRVFSERNPCESRIRDNWGLWFSYSDLRRRIGRMAGEFWGYRPWCWSQKDPKVVQLKQELSPLVYAITKSTLCPKRYFYDNPKNIQQQNGMFAKPSKSCHV